MTYCTLADMADRYGEPELIQLTDRDGLGEVDAAVLNQAIADACAVIDGHLAGRYTLPLATVPAILVGYACDLARERLYKDAATDLVVRRADEARKFLALVAQGKITLGVQPEPAGSGGIAYATPVSAMADSPYSEVI